MDQIGTAKRLRKNYGTISKSIAMPNLLNLQTASYDEFLGFTVDGGDYTKATKSRLESVFRNIFPIRDFGGNAELAFLDLQYAEPHYDEEECRARDITYAIPLRARLRLSLFDPDSGRGSKRKVLEVREQLVYIGDIPLMTAHGSFIVNGTERVIVSQLHRSPGVFFDHDRGRTHSSGKLLYKARLIPYRGSWLDFEFDSKDKMYFRIDLRRKMVGGILLKALGYNVQEILEYYYHKLDCRLADDASSVYVQFIPELHRDCRAPMDIYADGSNSNANTGEEKPIVLEGKKINRAMLRKLEKANVTSLNIPLEKAVGLVTAEAIILESGEILFEANHELSLENIESLEAVDVKEFTCLLIDSLHRGPWLADTLRMDAVQSKEEAQVEIYRMMRPGEPPTVETARGLFESMFFDAGRYDLSKVGRMKLNSRLNIGFDEAPMDLGVLRREDILKSLDVLLKLRDGHGETDDIDHLGNRRVRSVGELLENQIRLGLVRMERAIRERLASADLSEMTPADLLNSRPMMAAVREFFGSSQLSQFMDQTNPISEITHKRRLSALGPGGLSRERAGFEVRDVHPTHYGRMCPIETPEGPNIGLINSLACFASLNEFGFIETPYRDVSDGVVSDNVRYLSAIEETGHMIAQANAKVDDSGRYSLDSVQCRQDGNFLMAQPEQIRYMDVNPSQMVSVSAGLIPFLEHDDANRALMGSNMQRQAVPLMRVEKPLVGTGMESIVAHDSGVTVVAKRGGIIESVDAARIVVRVADDERDEGEPGVDVYHLFKYRRSNQSTCFNQRPLIKSGQKIAKGEIIADGPSTDQGELALGRNCLVAFMPWRGYNFEDAIVISERVVRDDVYTSVHIEEFDCTARQTKLGDEEITRDIPNVSEDSLRHLDETGITYVGAEVKPGDLLVGKVTPKGETQFSPEDKLLRAIFGEKAADTRDSSLRVKPGMEGVVVDVQILTRKGEIKDDRAKEIEKEQVEFLYQDKLEELRILSGNVLVRLRKLFANQIVRKSDGLEKGSTIKHEDIDQMRLDDLASISVADKDVNREVSALLSSMKKEEKRLEKLFESKVKKVREGADLKPGVIRTVKVFLAVKRKLQPGDKMAGRHGNKGVISVIVPEEDMPYTEDGTPVDVILNPLGVPSRMNLGQILEIHMGWAASTLGKQLGKMLDAKSKASAVRNFMQQIYSQDATAMQTIKQVSDMELLAMAGQLRKGVPIATPVFDGANEENIRQMLKLAGLPDSGQARLCDGKTGEMFDHPVTIGHMYILKLHHLVDEKIHARSIGPYSLVTQQPLGGKAHSGGQRFGEMEVWALEAYGAAYTLQEMLTVKSDDVDGRSNMYESIVAGTNAYKSGVPESFNVIVKELRALAININTVKSNEAE
ncbi:MAG: DNA-directed RNA polymerase subunit beta [Mariprofundales bacterium]